MSVHELPKALSEAKKATKKFGKVGAKRENHLCVVYRLRFAHMRSYLSIFFDPKIVKIWLCK